MSADGIQQRIDSLRLAYPDLPSSTAGVKDYILKREKAERDFTIQRAKYNSALTLLKKLANKEVTDTMLSLIEKRTAAGVNEKIENIEKKIEEKRLKNRISQRKYRAKRKIIDEDDVVEVRKQPRLIDVVANMPSRYDDRYEYIADEVDESENDEDNNDNNEDLADTERLR